MQEKIKPTKRILAYFLDILFVYLLISLISSIKIINPTYEKFAESFEKYNEVLEKYYDKEISADELNELNKDNLYNVTKYSVSTNVIIVIVLLGYFVLFQKYNNGQTLGKKIMKIKVVGKDKANVSIIKYILRILPMYFLYVGSIIPTVINSIAIFLVNSNTYMYINSITIYLFLFIAIMDFCLIYYRKDGKGLHDIISSTNVIYEENKA